MTKRGLPLAERLRLRLERRGDCLEWTGARTRLGYGSMRRSSTEHVAPHRLAWELAHGPIPDGLEVDHLCHNRACCEVGHLRLVTRSQNMQNQGRVRSSTGMRHVSPHGDLYQVEVTVRGVRYYGGNFRSPEDAEAAAIALRARVQDPIPELTVVGSPL